MRSDLADQITAAILELMERHGSDWRQSWTGNGLYRNAVTKKPYRGVNQPIIALRGFESNVVATYKQWGELGAQVRKGEKATHIFFYKPYAIRDRETDEEKQIMLARTYAVFSADQVDNAPSITFDKRPEIERHAECERIIADTGAAISYGHDKAAYIPSQDRIIMPAGNQFESRDAYYSTHFHELGHWAGAPTRLDRNLKGRFGDAAYAFEELIAESAAAIVCCTTGVTPAPRKETAQYLNSWMRGMRDDKQAIVRAFSHAQRAADFILRDEPAHSPDPARPEISADQPHPQP